MQRVACVTLAATVCVIAGASTGQCPVDAPDCITTSGIQGSGLLQVRTQRATLAVTYIPNPVPQHLADFVADAIDTAGMQTSSLPGPDGVPVTILSYSTSEDEFVSGVLNRGGSWEGDHVQRIVDAWRNEGSGKGNFLDVGANIGTFSLPIASVMKDKKHKVIAVEAMPQIADHLRAGIVANHAENIILFPYAIGQPISVNDVQMALNPTNKGGSTVVGNKDWTRPGRANAVEKFSVGLTTIDSLMEVQPEMRNVFYAKFDIEGNEGRALAGASKLFTKHPPCAVFFELNPGFLSNAGTSVDEIESELANYGYDIGGQRQLGVYDHEYRQKKFNECVSRLQ